MQHFYTLILDADDGETQFKDAGTEVGIIVIWQVQILHLNLNSDKDILFKGNDGGSDVTALTLDMSDAGAATFNNNEYFQMKD